MRKVISFLIISFQMLLCAAPIDVVIPCIEKDLPTLDLCIEGIRKHGKEVRRIIVVSKKRLTDKAEWFDETEYPFQKEDIAKAVYGNPNPFQPRVGWLFQQFLKLYAPLVIPDISENVLLLDADTVFLRPVEFVTKEEVALYNVGTECFEEYFEHLRKLLPRFEKVFPTFSGICHHMLIQRPIVEELIESVEAIHGKPFWEAVIDQLDKEKMMFSEYELYFNYVFSQKKKVAIRGLRWANVSKINRISKYRRRNFDYVSVHEWMKELL